MGARTCQNLHLDTAASVRCETLPTVVMNRPEDAAEDDRVRDDPNHISYPNARNHPAVDAVGPGRRVWQMTVSKDHCINRAGLQQLVDASGATAGSKLDFYFVVPADMYTAWKGKVKEKRLEPNPSPVLTCSSA
jgi:hypothetical protein